jgi:hypothetical protein
MALVKAEEGTFAMEKRIEVISGLIVEVWDGPPPTCPSLHIHNDDGDGIIVVFAGQISDFLDALDEAAGIVEKLAVNT